MIAGQIEIQMLAEIARLSKDIAEAKQQINSFATNAQRAGDLVRNALGSLGLGLSIGELIQFAKELVHVRVQAESLRTTLDFTSGGNSRRELEYLRKTTYDLGLEFQSTATSYGKFQAAARGTAIEGRAARDVFESVAKASSVMGLSADDTSGVLLALGQMVSKGTVQAEELRGQLGERLPGAFQIAARAMGVTTAELGKMLEQGLVPASEFLPRFAAQLNKELGDAAEKAADRTGASVARMANAWQQLKELVAEDAGVKDKMSFMSVQVENFTDRLKRAREAGNGVFGSLMVAQQMAFAEALGHVDVNAANLASHLRIAERDLKELQARASIDGGGFYLNAEVARAQRLVAELRAAKAAKDQLAGGNPNDQSQFKSRSQSYANWEEEQAKAAAKLAAVRNAGLGVNETWLKQLNELYALQQRGLISEKDYADAVQLTTAETYKKTAADKTQVEAGKKLIADAAARLQVLRQEAVLGEKLTDGQKFALDAMEALRDGRVKLTEVEKVALVNLIELIRKQELYAEGVKKARAEAEALAELRRKDNEAAEAHVAAEEARARQAARGAEEAVRAAQLEYQTQGLLRSQIAEVTLQRLLDEQAGLRAGTTLYEAKQREIDAQRELISVMRKSEVLDANAAAARAAAEEWQRTSDQIGQSLADALMQGGRSAGDYLKSYFRSLVLQPLIKAVVDPVSGAIAAFITGGAGGASGGGANAAAAGLNNANTLVSLYQAGTGYSSGVNALAAYLGAGSTAGASGASLAYANAVGAAGGDSLGALIASNGSWAGVGTSASSLAASESATLFASQAAGEGITVAGASSSGAGAGASSMSWGAAAAYIAMIYAAYMASRSAWEQGFNNDNLTGAFKYSPESTFTDLLKIGGMSDRAANIWGGGAVYTSIFGRADPRVTDQGFRGTIGAGDFSGEAYRDILEKGGLFRSDRRRTDTAALGSDLEGFLDTASKSILDQAKKFGEALGLPAQELASVTTQVRVTMTDDVEKNKAEIAKALGQYGDALIVGWTDELAPLKLYGETVSATVQRVGSAITSVNQVLEALGVKALAASVAGGQAAVQLEGFFGGIDKLTAAAGNYVSKFYTEAERTGMQTEAIAKALGSVNLQMPATRDGFRDLVEAQDLSTEAGRRAFTVLLANADAFDVVATAADQARQQLAQEAAARAQAAQQLMDQNVGKYLSGQDLERYRYGRVAHDLAAAGQGFGVDQLMGASKADIAAFIGAVVNLGDGASATEVALLTAAGALADLKDAAADAARESADAAAQEKQRADEVTARMADAWKQLQARALDGVASAYQSVAQLVANEQQRMQADAEKAVREAETKADADIRALEQQAQQIDRIFGSLLDSIGSNIRALSGELAGDNGRGQALATLRDGLAALSTGGAADMDALREAAGTASKVSTEPFASRLAYQRELSSTANLLRDLSGAARGAMANQKGASAGQQVAIERARDAQIAAIQEARDKQLHALDQQLLAARESAGRLVNIDAGVQTVAGAIADLATAIAAAGLMAGDKPTADNVGHWVRSGDTEVWGAAGGAVAARPVGATIEGTLIRGLASTFTQADAMSWVNDRLAANDIVGIYARAKAEGIDSAALDALMDWPAGTSLQGALAAGLPAFDVGSSYVPSTGLAVVHEGERILTAADNASLMAALTGGGFGADVCEELRGLRQEVAQLRAENMQGHHANAAANGKTARLMEDVVYGGESFATRAEA